MHGQDGRPGPVEEPERLLVLDVLRGFALLGILVVNMAGFAHPMLVLSAAKLPLPTVADRVADGLVQLLAAGKFYALFSLLFGVGQSLQRTRGRARGVDMGRWLARRQVVLLGIGIVHAFLIWPGDILIVYAVAGLFLILFHEVSTRTVLIAAGLVFLLGLGLNVGLSLLLMLLLALPGTEGLQEVMAAQTAEFDALVAEAYQVYARGNLLDSISMHAREYLAVAPGYLGMIPFVLVMFFLGLAVARTGWLTSVEQHRGRWIRILAVTLPVGLAVAAVGVAAKQSMVSAFEMSPPLVVYTASFFVGGPVLCFAYVAAIALVVGRFPSARPVRLVASAGRMALTCYLSQSVVWTLVFHGHGLGLIGQVGVAACTALAVGFWILQVLVAHLWLQRFRSGPVEWLWRSLTFGVAQPLARVQLPPSAPEPPSSAGGGGSSATSSTG